MTVNSREQAWREADKLFPTDYMKDDDASLNAGYDIYRSTLRTCDTDYYNYICDLGNCLEVNLTAKNWKSTTIRINISDRTEELRKELARLTKEMYPNKVA